MAATAYVLVSVQGGKAQSVYQKLVGLKGVTHVDVVFGPYDMIVQVQGTDSMAIGRLVLDTVSQIEGISDTITCNVIPVEQ